MIRNNLDRRQLNLHELPGYEMTSRGWLGKSCSSPVSTKVNKQKKSKKNIKKLPNKSVTTSPLDKFVQRKRGGQCSSRTYSPLQIETTKEKSEENSECKTFKRTGSFEKYGVIFPTPEDVLAKMDSLKKEAKLLDDYNDFLHRNNFSLSDSVISLTNQEDSIPPIPLLGCKDLTQSELDDYLTKYLEYLSNISNEIESSTRHQMYKNPNTRSKLTFNCSTIVFTQSQVEYLVKEIEKKLDPERDKSEYLFMVWLPELCLKIFMDLHEMSKEEAVKYLNNRPLD